ncbi:FAD synthetase [Mangrovicoccus sp. HB161399]|uniref:FAD synthetase n=1 Tax=Mangrovicoccus sp. HB161399 TaxID=2720392 RepID=UPI00155578C4|nr:FAD synthetase [Mangrovicoccus sp. HB161399]
MLDFCGDATRVLPDHAVRLAASVVTIGAFDGVHLGHQSLVRGAVAEAREIGVPAVVWTFDPPPKVMFGRAEPLVSTAGKLARLAALGPDVIVLASFTRAYAARPAAAFLADLARIAPRRVHVGADFRFGAGQAGDVALLARHLPVHVPRKLCCPAGVPVSSTRIRALLRAGRPAEAQALMTGGFPARAAGHRLIEDFRGRI